MTATSAQVLEPGSALVRAGQRHLAIAPRRRGHGSARWSAAPFAPSTHDMVREARIQRVMRAHGVPVPEVLAVCQDESILGVPFYLMPWSDGEVLTDSVPEALLRCPARSGSGACTWPGQSALGRHRRSGRIETRSTRRLPERQLHRFAALWDVNTARTLPFAEEVWRWLGVNRPETQTTAMVHGDYRLGNVTLHRSAPARLLAILDREMSTLGDPLAVLAYMTVTYSEPGEARFPVQMSTVVGQSLESGVPDLLMAAHRHRGV